MGLADIGQPEVVEIPKRLIMKRRVDIRFLSSSYYNLHAG